MAEIGVERLRAGDGQEHRAERDEADHADGRSGSRRHRVGLKARSTSRVLDDMPQPGDRQRDEPDQRDRAEEGGDARRAARLHREQRDQDHDRDRHNVGLEGRRHDLQALDRRQDRERRRDHRVAIKQRGADDAEQDDAELPRPTARCASAISASVPPSPLLSARSRITTYLTVTMRISAQMISDSTPRTTGSLAASPAPIAA